jgi:hypothetical protein
MRRRPRRSMPTDSPVQLQGVTPDSVQSEVGDDTSVLTPDAVSSLGSSAGESSTVNHRVRCAVMEFGA